MPHENMKRRGLMFILSSPSGAGKTTLSHLLMQNDPNLTMSISYTTRPIRPNEQHGVDYFFVSEQEFEKKANEKYFYEFAEVFGNFYGTPRKRVEDELSAGRDVLFDIDWQGTRRLTAKARDDIVSVFILPPSMEELSRRLKSRAQDSSKVITTRMEHAADEISHWDEYDYVVINDSIDYSLQNILYILKAERLKRRRQNSLPDFVGDLLKQKI